MPVGFALLSRRKLPQAPRRTIPSHDDYYFQRPDRITSERPPQPYVDLRRRAIAQRVLNKEVLRQAFIGLGLFVGDGGDNVHGEFGDATNWNQPPNATTTATVEQDLKRQPLESRSFQRRRCLNLFADPSNRSVFTPCISTSRCGITR